MPSSFPEAVRCLTAADEAFPLALRDLKAVPRALWVHGTLAAAEAPAVAIVGTRRSTPYGERVAKTIATLCARHGVCVVSGLAAGIDA
ncbi:DNA-processing protein DprA, partial [Gemmatimonas sp.]|uniref:DNA-processing protein DprA n=1 Tax=Gemmatimonas sp. TaxID=1962908 RepID=UPI00391C0AA1